MLSVHSVSLYESYAKLRRNNYGHVALCCETRPYFSKNTAVYNAGCRNIFKTLNTSSNKQTSSNQAVPLLLMSDIDKSFVGQQVLHQVSFDLRRGEVHVLAGENGAGKSTLIKILAGVHLADAGNIYIQGETVTPRTPNHANELGISVIHQELSLISSMTVVDNIFLGREKRGRLGWMQYKAQENACRKLLLDMGIEGIKPNQTLGTLSLAAQQTVEIAKALAFDAKIFVMDEPTSALSTPEVEALFKHIHKLREMGCGIIYITHKMDEIYSIADRITVLRDGHLIGTSNASELPRADLVHWMVGRSLQELYPEKKSPVGETRLQVNNVSLISENNQRQILSDISFEVRRGEILGLGGLSGAGSSELLAALFGCYGKRLQGDVHIDGDPCTPNSPHDAVHAGIALLTNDRKNMGLVLNLGLRENITLASVPAYTPYWWLSRKRETACAEHYRELLRIRMHDLTQPVDTLSGGNQQKVYLAKWLETKPRVLLLDEPTRGVDVGAKHEIYELMQSWAASGMAILLITSEMPELLAMSDRIMVMHRGKVTATLDKSNATQDAILLAAMGGDHAA